MSATEPPDSPIRSVPVLPFERLSFVDNLDQKQFRLHSRQTMIALSHIIEEHTPLGGAETVLIATFQRLSLFAIEAARYQLLAPQLSQIYVFGVPDLAVPAIAGVTVVPLDPAWPLVQEWSVIACGPALSVGLFAHDREGFRPEKRSRAFEGLFSTNTTIIDTAIARLYTTLARPAPTFKRNTQATLQNTTQIQRALAAQR